MNTRIEKILPYRCSSSGQLSGGLCSCASDKQCRFGQTRWQPPRWTPTLASRPGETGRDEQAHKNGDAARAGIEKLADFRKGPEGIMVERSGGQSIHIVDDDEAMCDWLAALVEAAGLSAKTYASAVELLNSPGGLAADCFVADIRMPEMDGLQLQQELTRRGIFVPLIIITGHSDVGFAVQAMKA